MMGRLVRGAGLVALLALMVLASFSCKGRGAGPPDSLARVRAAGVLRWGGDVQGGEPYIYEDPEHPGQQKGFEVDLAAALARELGVRPQFVQNDWSALVPSLERGTFDVILNGLEVMPSRVGRVRFTRPYYVFASRLMARRDDTRPQFQVTPQHPVTLDSLRGLRVGTLTNSFCAGIMEGHAEVVLYEGTEEPYVDLVQGRTDAVLFDDIIATRYGEPKPELRVVADLQDGFYSAALRPADETLAVALDQALGRLIERGELERILRGENIWNERQVGLRTWGPTDQARMLGPGAAQSAQGPPPRRRMSLTQAWMFVQASGVTLLVSVLAMLLAVPLGLFLAVLRLYAPAPLAKLAGAYVEFYRGTPVLLQLYVLYYGLAEVINLKPMTAAVLGLAMNYGAYEAEVYRAGIQAVPKGQFEAAVSLGMTTPLALRRVILPQAFRLALPSVTNDFIALLKDSSMVSIITVVELTKRMTIVAVDTRSYVLPGLLCAGLYFLMSYPLSLVAQRLEERLARS